MPSGPKNPIKMNRHAREAMARDNERQSAEQAARQKAAEDAYWEDSGDKKSQRAAERAAEREAKEQAKLERKAENRSLYETESKKAKKGGEMAEFRRLQEELSREARDDLDERRQREEEEAERRAAAAAKKTVGRDKVDLTRSNKNAQGDDDDDQQANPTTKANSKAAAAKTLDAILTTKDATSAEFSRTMGKRAKVLFKKFCDENSEGVRKENPSLRRTQVNDMLWEMWQKDPQNPFVQRREALAGAAAQARRDWMEAPVSSGSDDDDDAAEEKPTAAKRN